MNTDVTYTFIDKDRNIHRIHKILNTLVRIDRV